MKILYLIIPLLLFSGCAKVMDGLLGREDDDAGIVIENSDNIKIYQNNNDIKEVNNAGENREK